MATVEEQNGSATTDPVGVIGTGANGSAVARTYLGAGRRVVVWNRTADRAADVVRRAQCRPRRHRMSCGPAR